MLFPEWETFYLIVGSSAGALAGLMFVVMALVADFGGTERQLQAFGTPTLVHFSAALLVSLILSAPWPAAWLAQLALLPFGLAGVGYMVVVLRRARRQTDYKPVAEDWLFHGALPLIAYISILVAGSGLPRRTSPHLFVLGGAAVLLVFIGIHNAWDTVTYIVVARWEARRERQRE